MTSDLPSDAPSPGAEGEPGSPELALVSLLRARGEPLLDALESHLPGSRERCGDAAELAHAAAEEMGLTRSSAELVREATRLHDIGRVYVPAETLAKPEDERTPEESEQIEGHHEMGAQLARGAGIPDRVCTWIRLGAERFDGTGPAGLAGDEIPIQARFSRAGYAAHDALRAGSPEAGAHAEALRAASGSELDPAVVAALEAVLNRDRAD
jgi:putative nucleotidyltransferase with HDIG domain